MSILTCGVFDLLHTGHIKFLNKIKNKHNKLIVLLHSNRFVLSYKKKRPIIDEKDRLVMIQSLNIVDECFISDKDFISLEIIKKYNINMVYQASTSDEKNIWDFYYHIPIELDIMKYIPYSETHLSTTKIINKIVDNSIQKTDNRYSKKEILKNEKFYGLGYQSPDITHMFEKIISTFNLNSNNNVLEIGSGLGGNLIYIKNKFNCNTIGVDINNKMINMCKERYKNIKFILADYIDYQSDATYDLILSRDVFMYISTENKYRYIQKVKSHLKKGGKFFLIDYCYNNLSKEFIKYYTNRSWKLSNIKTYKKIFKVCGFKVIQEGDISNNYLTHKYKPDEININILKNYDIKKKFIQDNAFIWYYFVLEK